MITLATYLSTQLYKKLLSLEMKTASSGLLTWEQRTLSSAPEEKQIPETSLADSILRSANMFCPSMNIFVYCQIN